MKKINFTNEQIEQLKIDPRVKYVDSNKLVFTLEFRIQLYDSIYPNLNACDVRNGLNAFGFDTSILPTGFCYSTSINFKKRKPCGASNKQMYDHNTIHKFDKSYDKVLLDSGYFVKIRKGIAPSNKLLDELRKSNEISIEEYLTKLGFDINKIGYHRIYRIAKLLGKTTSASTNSIFTDEQIAVLKANPYVEKITISHITLSNNFYNEAIYYKSLNINEIFRIFEINPDWISYSRKCNIYYKIQSHQYVKCDELKENYELLIKVEQNKYDILSNTINNNFNIIKPNIKTANPTNRKEICKLIDSFDYTSKFSYSKQKLLSLFGISKSSYYSILKNDNYGTYELRKQEEDEKDIAHIKEVIAYKDYPKGNRTIYMMLDRKNHHMSRNKIYRLCRKANLACLVRKHNKSRQAAQRLLKANCKPNLLKREFKLCKPGDVTLTDVSYLKCKDKTYYLSALKDACSGKVKLIVSDKNDLNLAMNTLKLLANTKTYKLFHSDQGILYLNDLFQNKLKELGYTQSMSKRGNCWDNAPQESFFGHMKDECDIKSCSSFDEITKMISDYEYYYNYERPQWNRNHMTPIEFEEYINAMSDDEYNKYLEIETKKYEKMMENAKIKAKKRIKDISIEEN